MPVLTSEWRERIDHWIRTLKRDFYHPLQELSWEVFFTMDHLSLKEAKAQSFTQSATCQTWGHSWEYGWFRTRVMLPPEAAGQRIVLNPGFGAEATIFVNGSAFGTYRADWVEEEHHYIEDNALTTDGIPGKVFEIYMEVYAGHYFPRRYDAENHRATGPVMEGDYEDPLAEGQRCTVGVSTVGIWNEDAYQLYMDVTTLDQLLPLLDETSLRAAKIAEALEQFTLCVDFEQDADRRNADYRTARKLLRPVLESKNGATMPTFYAVGNAHIDLAWLWPLEETHRKTARTFAAQLRLLEEYPDYRFIQSQPAAYEMCRNCYPELFERILQAIKDGRWIADGAMWVEPDTNMTGGESLIRQLLYGKQYYKDILGVDSEVLWLPDTFGYTAALPQILQGCGVRYLVTQKIFWSYNGGEQFPCHYFSWEGMDGSQITTFLPTSYTYQTTPAETNRVWKERAQTRDLEAFLYPFGYGDGGGGPCRDHIEYAQRGRNLEGSVKMKSAGPREFFSDMDAVGGPKHTYVGELYFTAHRGTYTTQAAVKRGNRKSELLMRELELWAALASLRGYPYPDKEAEQLWKVILLHQFHDILPGSSIARVYEEARQAYHDLTVQAEGLLYTALGAFTASAIDNAVQDKAKSNVPQEHSQSTDAPGKNSDGNCTQTISTSSKYNPHTVAPDGITVWNSLSFERNAVVSLPEHYRNGAVLNENPIPVYDGINGLQAAITIPAFGAVTLFPLTGSDAPSAHSCLTKNTPPVTLTKTDAGYVFENSRLRAIADAHGEIISFRLKSENGSLNLREFAAGNMNRLRLFKTVPRRYDAWDIDSNYTEQEIVPAASQINCRILQASGAEALLEVSGQIGNSSCSQIIRLQANARRLEFETTIDWHEQHRLLKAAFPVSVYADNGINEMQFGYVRRPTHRSRAYDRDRFEVCNHRYSALCEENHGAAVLNDCKYGISMNGNSLELTLLSAATCPDRHADQGRHIFTYAFTAWEETFFESDVVLQGYELNVPPVVTTGSCQLFSAFAVDAENIILETVKCAADGSGDLILRLYESKKAGTFAKLQINLDAFGVPQDGYKLFICDMLENKKEQISVKQGTANLCFRPFEIRTLRLVII
ncbi:MAG: glycosyl hydrolase-related protein [Lachnospiraceae bacterium]|nr:glycosyl hydrolase-related protein [Lachnospiraceae bacterium]